MTINANTIKLPLDDDRRSLIQSTLSEWFAKVGDEDSEAECWGLPDETLVKWAKEEFGGSDSFWEDEEGRLIDRRGS